MTWDQPVVPPHRQQTPNPAEPLAPPGELALDQAAEDTFLRHRPWQRADMHVHYPGPGISPGSTTQPHSPQLSATSSPIDAATTGKTDTTICQRRHDAKPTRHRLDLHVANCNEAPVHSARGAGRIKPVPSSGRLRRATTRQRCPGWRRSHPPATGLPRSGRAPPGRNRRTWP